MIIFGYLDPGTGSLIIQSIIGIAAGIGVFGRKAIREVFYKIKPSTRRSKTEVQNSESAAKPRTKATRKD